jgi:hypothetical protein
MEPKTTVIADDREASADVVQHFLARPDCEVIIRRLRLGDYHIAAACWSSSAGGSSRQIDGRLFNRRAGWPAHLHTVLLLEGGKTLPNTQ